MGNMVNYLPYKLLTSIDRILNFIYSLCVRCAIPKHKNIHFQKPTIIIGGRRISIGEKTYFSSFLELCAWDSYRDQKFNPTIKIGKNCSFGRYNHISAINHIQIGNNLLTGRNVTICDNNHGMTTFDKLTLPPLQRPLCSKGEIIIGDNVWLGDKVTILGGVTIGDGVVVAANSVITKDIPSYCVAGGNPASIIKSLSPDTPY